MNEIQANQNNLLNENENENDKGKSKRTLSSTIDHIKNFHDLNRYFVNHKNTSSFKLKLIKDINFMEKYIKTFTFLKFLLGFILLSIPFIIIIFFIYLDYSERNKYIFFSYFLSISIIMGSLVIILVIKIGDACRTYGILIVSWERKYMFKIIRLISISLFFLWFLFLCEEFVNNFNLLKEKVAQSNNKEISSKKFNEGSYMIRLLFILLFWDTEKNEKGDYSHQKIGYFEYESNFFNDFHTSLRQLLIPIISLCFFYLIKIFFIKTKNELIYSILLLITLFESFYFLFYSPTNEDNSKIEQDNNTFLQEEDGEEYFKNNNIKYLEIIPLTIIIILLIVLNYKRCIIDLIHNKFYPYHSKKKNTMIFCFVIFSFVINVFGYFIFLFVLYSMYFRTIDEKLKISTYNNYWAMIYISICLILIGYSYPFGNYCFKLMYYPTAYETFGHVLKNNYYIYKSQKKEKDRDKEKLMNSQTNSSF